MTAGAERARGAILVTGASGKTGRAVLGALPEGVPAFALVRTHEAGASLRSERPSCEPIVGDLLDPEPLAPRIDGVRAIYHICPNVHPGEVEIGASWIELAERCGVERFVFHSVLHPAIEAMPHHWRKMRVEERLFASRLGWTVLQPAAYFQNLDPLWTSILEAGELPLPYPTTTRMGMVDLDDVAAVAAQVLTESGHAGAIYELAGSEISTPVDWADAISAKLGRSVRAVEIALESWSSRARRDGLSVSATDELTRMFGYYAEHGFFGNPTVLRALLGREPSRFDGYVGRRLSTASLE